MSSSINPWSPSSHYAQGGAGQEESIRAQKIVDTLVLNIQQNPTNLELQNLRAMFFSHPDHRMVSYKVFLDLCKDKCFKENHDNPNDPVPKQLLLFLEEELPLANEIETNYTEKQPPVSSSLGGESSLKEFTPLHQADPLGGSNIPIHQNGYIVYQPRSNSVADKQDAFQTARKTAEEMALRHPWDSWPGCIGVLQDLEGRAIGACSLKGKKQQQFFKKNCPRDQTLVLDDVSVRGNGHGNCAEQALFALARQAQKDGNFTSTRATVSTWFWDDKTKNYSRVGPPCLTCKQTNEDYIWQDRGVPSLVPTTAEYEQAQQSATSQFHPGRASPYSVSSTPSSSSSGSSYVYRSSPSSVADSAANSSKAKTGYVYKSSPK